ncbi:hypothetical protein N7470_002819 [Penicillium chermesinum]|nr:hypothetical protein N7470_002819 [Penicillium chermesinum]
MDTQFPFASRDELWNIIEQLKEVRIAQVQQSERIVRLERRKDEDARLKNVWGPPVAFPDLGNPVFYSPPDAFKGFDQGQPNGMASSGIGLDGDEEPRRGASRANSVRFDESAIHGYYGQASRSSTDLPLRTGSGMGGLPLSERSLSHRSDGRLSSSGQSLHSARTNSLRLDTTSRLMGSFSDSPITPPPGLFLLGPVPCIIRCWLTANYSNDTLLYAAVCSGSYGSIVGESMIRKLGLEDSIFEEENQQFIRLRVWLPEASRYPEQQLPTLTIRFMVRQSDASDESIQIIMGSDVLRSHNADILLSKDKILMVDDDRNRISIPLVRPERDSVFKSLSTVSNGSRHSLQSRPEVEKDIVGVIGPPKKPHQSASGPASEHVSTGDAFETKKNIFPDAPTTTITTTESPSTVNASDAHSTASQPEAASVWGSWRRSSKPDPNTNASKPAPSRTMKVLRPTKPSSRTASSTSTPVTPSADQNDTQNGSSGGVRRSSDDNSATSAANPVGGASAFGWLTSVSTAQKAMGSK